MMRRLVLALCLLLPILAGAQQREQVAPADFVPVDSRLVRETLQELLASWDDMQLEPWLADEFGLRYQLLEVLRFDAPFDARVRLLSIGPVRIIEQQRGDASLTSTIAVRVLTQIEYEAPGLGFQRHEGIAEYVLRLNQRVPD